MKTAFVINGKIKKFPSLLSPESLDDTAFDAVSSKLADYSVKCGSIVDMKMYALVRE